MSKQEAIELIKTGGKVVHRHFSEGEFITMTKDGMIESEEGYRFVPSLFWKDRTGSTWEDDWSGLHDLPPVLSGISLETWKKTKEALRKAIIAGECKHIDHKNGVCSLCEAASVYESIKEL